MEGLKARWREPETRQGKGQLPLLVTVLVLLTVPALAQDEHSEEIEHSLIKPLASRSLLLDATAVEGRMVAVGERGHVLISDDAGDSWRQVVVPTRADLTGVHFHDRDLGWVVGHDAVILRTRDGGESWERLHWAPEEERPFFDVWFSDAENGFVIGAYSYFLSTADGGDSWEPREISAPAEEEEADPYALPVEYHLNHLARAASGKLYIAAEAGTIYRSDDGGEGWKTLPSPYHGSFFGCLPLAEDSLLVFGLRGNLFRSDDAGETWSAIDTGTVAILNDGRTLADGTIVIVGTAGAVLLSRDGGETFELRPRADRQALATVLEAGADELILIGEFGVNRLPLSEL